MLSDLKSFSNPADACKKILMRIYPGVVTPECFNRGSTMLTTTLSRVEWVGASSGLAWISAEGRIRPKPCGGPDRSIRE